MKLRYAFLIPVWLCAIPHAAEAQDKSSDSHKLGQENRNAGAPSQNKKVHIMKGSMINETQLFRLTFQPIITKNYSQEYHHYGLINKIGYERKLGLSLSWVAELNNRLYFDDAPALKSNLSVSLRYFYSMVRNINNRKSGNNLLSSYFEFRMRDIADLYLYQNSKINRSNAWMWPGTYPQGFVISWGFQKRFGKYGFFDLSAGFGPFITTPILNPSSRIFVFDVDLMKPEIKISLGLAPLLGNK